ncbi:MAG: DUF7521 family protein [Halobacteriota archaeon]
MADLTSLATGIVVAKTGIMVLGDLLIYLSFSAARRTDSESLELLAVGFGVVTTGALLAGMASLVFGLPLQTGVLVDLVLTPVRFAVITCSLSRD